MTPLHPTSAESSVTTAPTASRFSPWLTPLVYFLGRWLVIPFYFGQIEIVGQENLLLEGPVILAPTHRSRWDAVLVPYATGRIVTGRDLRFMVSADEVKGVQGWFIRRLGGFPVNPRKPAIATLRHGMEILQNQEMLVIFPEGGIFRDDQVHPLKPGLARIALQAQSTQPDLDVKIVPIHLQYEQSFPRWGCNVVIRIGCPIKVSNYSKGAAKLEAKRLTADLETTLKGLSAHEVAEEEVLSAV